MHWDKDSSGRQSTRTPHDRLKIHDVCPPKPRKDVPGLKGIPELHPPGSVPRHPLSEACRRHLDGGRHRRQGPRPVPGHGVAQQLDRRGAQFRRRPLSPALAHILLGLLETGLNSLPGQGQPLQFRLLLGDLPGIGEERAEPRPREGPAAPSSPIRTAAGRVAPCSAASSVSPASHVSSWVAAATPPARGLTSTGSANHRHP